MFASVGKLISNVKSYYNEINSATLTGAIDILVIEQPDGSYLSSPFHVRFGKMGVIRSREKVVYIEINGEPTDLHMKLGPHGEAFFVQEVLEKWEGPDYLATSPIIPSPLKQAVDADRSPRRQRNDTGDSTSSSCSDLTGSTPVGNMKDAAKRTQSNPQTFKPINQTDDEMLESGGMFTIEVSDDESKNPEVKLSQSSLTKTASLPILEESSRSRTENWAFKSFHPFSDTDLTPAASPAGSRPPTPKSDAECEYSERPESPQESGTKESLKQWNWGELPRSSTEPKKIDLLAKEASEDISVKTPEEQEEESKGLWSFMKKTKKLRHKPDKGGIYLDDLNLEDMDPEVAALYFPKRNRSSSQKAVAENPQPNIPEEDSESGRGASLPRSPIEDLPTADHDNRATTVNTPSSETGTMKDPEFGIYGDIAMSLCGAHLDDSNQVAEDIFNEHQITYPEFCDKSVEILQNPNLIIRISGKHYNWTTAAPMVMSMMAYHQTLDKEAADNLVKTHMPKKQKISKTGSWWPFSRGAKAATEDVEAGDDKSTHSTTPGTDSVKGTRRYSESGDEADDEKEDAKDLKDQEVREKVVIPIPEEVKVGVVDQTTERYVKTIRLNSEQLERLNLHEGKNEIEFSVTTAYQGTTRAQAHIYLWKHTDKIVVSDIDGTITKSDVLGQLFPLVGKEWWHGGVASLFTKIANNGYKVIYLSARAIGQATSTRDFLRTVKQAESNLPEGPLFLNPSSLINAFHREVIARKPEEFKISCLKDIQSLFSTANSLYAGFGNRINDMFAYRAVGIEKSRMFLIDSNGKLKSDFSQTFNSSYVHLSDVVDHYFPPISGASDQMVHFAPAEFSSFTYWREPVLEVDVSSLG